MKKLFFIAIFFLAITSFAQTEDQPVHWLPTSVEKISDTEYDLIISARILDEWHLYSQYNPEDASLPLVISAEENENFILVGKAKESETHKEYTEVWGKDEIFFKENATITQRIKLINKDITSVKLNVTGQVCKQACLQVDETFTFSLNGGKIEKEIVVLDDNSKKLTNSLKLDLKNTSLLKSATDSDSEGGSGLFSIFFLGFVGGLLALLTPCVFPMIPLTVSFFTKQSKTKRKGVFNAVLYGLFIVFIYILLSIPFHFLDNLDPEILNTISTNVWL